jgi:hypothetical protein
MKTEETLDKIETFIMLLFISTTIALTISVLLS